MTKKAKVVKSDETVAAAVPESKVTKDVKEKVKRVATPKQLENLKAGRLVRASNIAKKKAEKEAAAAAAAAVGPQETKE